MFLNIPSVHNHTGGSVFTNGLGYDSFYPWKRKGEHPQAQMEFIQDSGVPHTLVSDNAPESIKLNNVLLFLIAHGRIWPKPVFVS
jgi:hypothetical protein